MYLKIIKILFVMFLVFQFGCQEALVVELGGNIIDDTSENFQDEADLQYTDPMDDVADTEYSDKVDDGSIIGNPIGEEGTRPMPVQVPDSDIEEATDIYNDKYVDGTDSVELDDLPCDDDSSIQCE